MSTLKLTPEDTAAIQRILTTEDIPANPEEEAFTEAVNKIMETDPELAQRYILSVPIAHPTKPTQNLLRSEQEARQAKLRQTILNTQRSLLMRKVDGDWVPSQPKIWAVTLVVLVAALGVAVANYINVTNNRTTVNRPTEPAPITVTLPEPEPIPEVAPTPAAVPNLPPAPVLEIAPAPTPTPAAVPNLPAAPPTTNLPPLPNLNQPTTEPAYDDAGIAYDVDLTKPMTINRQNAPATGLDAPLMGLYRQSITPQTAPGSVLTTQITSYRDTTTVRLQPELTQAPPTTPTSITINTQTPPTNNLTLATETNNSTFFNALSINTELPPTGTLTIANRTNNQNTQTNNTTNQITPPQNITTNNVPTNNNPTTRTNVPPNTPTTSSTPAPAPGQRINAMLVTSATVIDGQVAPVAIETICSVRDTTCVPTTFLGQASLIGGTRIIINIDTMIHQGNVTRIQAIALGPNNTTNIPAYFTEETPTIANDMFRSAIGGLSKYVEALANRTTTTIVGDRVIEERPEPNLLDFIGGNVANLFNFQNDTTSFVRLAEIPAGTNVTILIGTSY